MAAISESGRTIYPERVSLFVDKRGEWVIAISHRGKLRHLRVHDDDIAMCNQLLNDEMERATNPDQVQ